MTRNARRGKRLLRLAKYQENRCFYCGTEMLVDRPDTDPLRMSEDHFIPKSCGGTNNVFNIVVAHAQCNSVKTNKLPTQEDQNRLDALNAIRALDFLPNHGDKNHTQFGSCEAAKYLIGVVAQHPNSGRISQRCSRMLEHYTVGLHSINHMPVNMRERFAQLWRQDYISRINTQFADEPPLLRNLMCSLIATRLKEVIRKT
jgi:hypothetical protein